MKLDRFDGVLCYIDQLKGHDDGALFHKARLFQHGAS